MLARSVESLERLMALFSAEWLVGIVSTSSRFARSQICRSTCHEIPVRQLSNGADHLYCVFGRKASKTALRQNMNCKCFCMMPLEYHGELTSIEIPELDLASDNFPPLASSPVELRERPQIEAILVLAFDPHNKHFIS